MENEQKSNGLTGEQRKKLTEVPVNTPEHYAQYYLMPENDVEFFEKIKALHDYCQENDLPIFIISEFRCKKPASFFHLTSDCSPNQSALADAAVRKLLYYTSAFLKWMTKGAVKVITEH